WGNAAFRIRRRRVCSRDSAGDARDSGSGRFRGVDHGEHRAGTGTSRRQARQQGLRRRDDGGRDGPLRAVDHRNVTMPARHRSRQRALQVMYLWDLRRQPLGEAIDSFYKTLSSEEENPQPTPPDEFMETLVRGASDQAEEIDKRIATKSEHWRLDRMP